VGQISLKASVYQGFRDIRRSEDFDRTRCARDYCGNSGQRRAPCQKCRMFTTPAALSQV
jgi:hypothetical protein